MPSKKQEFSFPGQRTEQLLLIAYGTFLELGWTPKYAGPNAIIGYTPRSWNKYDDEITITATDESITVSSSLVHNESFDMLGKNKKHIEEFIAAFEKIKAKGIQPEWVDELEKVRQQTIDTATQQEKQANEVNEVMHLAGATMYVTYGLIAINIIVFILMAIDGAGIFDPDGLTHIKWGSNYSPLTLSGDWWRLVTNMFIHFGVIHLALNMYSLYILGVFLEPMLGKVKLVVAYLCTGVFASIASIWWHSEGINSAGASGAIFGMFGVFLALLLTNLIPKQIRTGLLRSIGIVIAINLIYGMKSGVDNAAHIGGLLSGIVIGFIFYPLLKNNLKGIRNQLSLAAIVGITVLVAWSFLNSPGNKLPGETRRNALNELNSVGFADSEKYLTKMKAFQELEAEALAPFNEKPPLSDSLLLQKLRSISIEKWNRALQILGETANYDISDRQKKRNEILTEYVTLRLEQIKIVEQMIREGSQENNTRFEDSKKRIEGLNKQFKSLN